MPYEGVQVVNGAEAGAWIEPHLGGEFGAVSLQVPKVFDAYARIFHPPTDEKHRRVTWAEAARRLGRTAHREMQWHQIVESTDTDGLQNSNWSGSIPEWGRMELDDLDRLGAVLADRTADPEHCFSGLCRIDRSPVDDLTDDGARVPDLELPLGRDMVVFAGSLSAVLRLEHIEQRAAIERRGEREELIGPRFPEGFALDWYWREAPSIIWPADRSWFVTSEVDFDSTLVGGNRSLIDDLVAAPGLEVYEVDPDTSLAAFSDKLNPVELSEGKVSGLTPGLRDGLARAGARLRLPTAVGWRPGKWSAVSPDPIGRAE
jgi:hypothetical protein